MLIPSVKTSHPPLLNALCANKEFICCSLPHLITPSSYISEPLTPCLTVWTPVFDLVSDKWAQLMWSPLFWKSTFRVITWLILICLTLILRSVTSHGNSAQRLTPDLKTTWGRTISDLPPTWSKKQAFIFWMRHWERGPFVTAAYLCLSWLVDCFVEWW